MKVETPPGELANEVLATFESLGFGTTYIMAMRKSLTGKDSLAVLKWCSRLDDRCLKALARRLTLSVGDLRSMTKNGTD